MGLRRMLLNKLTNRRRDPTDVFGLERSYLMSDTAASQNGANDATIPTPTVAAFSPNQQTASRTRNQQTILIHQKSPLLVATPPQVTRVLAYSHPFILPLNHLLGLFAWDTGDPWESFLFLVSFWCVLLYGNVVIRWMGPVVLVIALILGMYSRRYSPLSSSTWSDAKKIRKRADADSRKSLDEILDTLQSFTQRCDVLLDPFLRLTEYLSTQSSATSATTRPALTTLFIRILAFTPIWIACGLPPLRIITTQRVVLVFGTVVLSWHSVPARVSRTILWRSQTVRKTVALLTGLHFVPETSSIGKARPPLPPRNRTSAVQAAQTRAKDKRPNTAVRFTFTLFENQRRWIGLGWTPSLFAYERQAWTDEHLHTTPPPSEYDVPETDTDSTKWRWLPGSEWRVDGANTEKEKSAKRIGGGGGGDESGWVYFDNKWLDGRKEDGWSRYTRRRKWVRDAELIELNPDGTEVQYSETTAETSSIDSATTTPRKRGWFGGSGSSAKLPPTPSGHAHNKSISSVVNASDASSMHGSVGSTRSRMSADEEDVQTPLERYKQYDWDRSLNEGIVSQLS